MVQVERDRITFAKSYKFYCGQGRRHYLIIAQLANTFLPDKIRAQEKGAKQKKKKEKTMVGEAMQVSQVKGPWFQVLRVSAMVP